MQGNAGRVLLGRAPVVRKFVIFNMQSNWKVENLTRTHKTYEDVLFCFFCYFPIPMVIGSS